MDFSKLRWDYIGLGFGLFVVTAAVSLVVIGWLLVAIPATYFLPSHQRDIWIDRHPVVRWSGRILKNLAGVGLVALGIVLSLPGVPGQGLLTILVGIMLLDFPGKRRVELAIVRRPAIHRNINRLRKRFGKPPLELPELTKKKATPETDEDASTDKDQVEDKAQAETDVPPDSDLG